MKALKIIVAILIVVNVALWGGYGILRAVSGTNTASADNAGSDTPTASTPAESTQSSSLPESGAVGDYTVTIGNATFTTDIDGNPAIVINYDFTNNSNESVMPTLGANMNAYQDGVELEVAMILDSSVYDAGIGQRDVQPGASLAGCQHAYVLTSTSPVEVQVSPLFGDVALEKTFTVQ